MTTETLERPKADPWPEAEVEKLVTLWDSGLSTSRIAAALGTGKSRNSILGKLHRLGKLEHAPVVGEGEERERPRPPKPARARPSLPHLPQRLHLVKPEPPTLVIVAPTPARKDGDRITVALLEPWMCRWPHGDPGTDDFHFCGAEKHGTSSYCEYHAKRAVAPTQAGRNLKRATTEKNVTRAIRRGP